MSFHVKEIYYTLQGEGAHAGRGAVFCRMTGCNLWSGREEDRADAICTFCDTDFIGVDGPGGGVFPGTTDLASAVRACWDQETDGGRPYVVFTGGEPLLQVTEALVEACHELGFEVAIETNGTKPAPENIDWICMSPKAGADLHLRSGNELKLVYPQEGLTPSDVEDLDFEFLFLQPMDGPQGAENIQLAAEYCMRHPRWRLSLQTHKLIGLP